MLEARRQSVLSAILRDEQATHLWLAVGQLPESYREAVVLHYVEGLDYSQISQITGVSEGALRVPGTARPQPVAHPAWPGGRHLADQHRGNRRQPVTFLRDR